MCSIAAYAGALPAAQEIAESLSHMAYRGYDSAGMSVWDGRRASTVKVMGTDLSGHGMAGRAGIGQTRWATHGANDITNANPQVSGDTVAAVMNGTVSNYYEVRADLEARGYIFTSDNDTEAVAHMAGMLRGDLRGLMGALHGRFSCIILHRGRLGCVRRGPSLSIGKAEDGMHIASDAAAFSARADMVYNMPNDAYAYVDDSTCRPYGSGGRPIACRYERVAPEVSTPRVDAAISHTEAELLDGSRLLAGMECGWRVPDGNVAMTGSGSSYHAALLAEHLLRLAGRRVEVFPACEYASHPPAGDATLVAISQSGETGDVLRAVESYPGADVVSITNNAQSSLAAMSDRTIPLGCGPEIGVAATKSFMAQAGILMSAAGMPYGGGPMPDPDTMPRSVIDMVSGAPDVYILGSGIQRVAALEGALKLKELLYAHAEGMYAGEFKHGPLAMLEKGTPVIVLDAFGDSADTIQEVMARGGHAIVVSGDARPPYGTHVRIDASGGVQDVFMREAWLLQMLAIRAAAAARRDVDRPRNLAKCVTV